MSVVWEVSFSTRRLPWSSAHSPCVRLAHLSWGCPKIASPSGSLPESLPRLVPPFAFAPDSPRRSERSCPGALAPPARLPTSPFSRPRRLSPPLAAGMLHPAPILRFGPFRSGSALASPSFPVPRSCPPKLRSSPRATRTVHTLPAADRHRRAVADTPFTGPLAPSFLVGFPSGTSRPCSPDEAVPTCTVSRAAEPLLPWACPSLPSRHREARMDVRQRSFFRTDLSVSGPRFPVRRPTLEQGPCQPCRKGQPRFWRGELGKDVPTIRAPTLTKSIMRPRRRTIRGITISRSGGATPRVAPGTTVRGGRSPPAPGMGGPERRRRAGAPSPLPDWTTPRHEPVLQKVTERSQET